MEMECVMADLEAYNEKLSLCTNCLCDIITNVFGIDNPRDTDIDCLKTLTNDAITHLMTTKILVARKAHKQLKIDTWNSMKDINQPNAISSISESGEHLCTLERRLEVVHSLLYKLSNMVNEHSYMIHPLNKGYVLELYDRLCDRINLLNEECDRLKIAEIDILVDKWEFKNKTSKMSNERMPDML